uniref:C3H1-type domain-containing protein n=1 Tax=Amphimedon queenslandica TaxID=400682 RepID=A0A1X7TIX5_AMPQE
MLGIGQQDGGMCASHLGQKVHPPSSKSTRVHPYPSKQACKKFNNRYCKHIKCKYSHICSFCSSPDHVAPACPKAPPKALESKLDPPSFRGVIQGPLAYLTVSIYS